MSTAGLQQIEAKLDDLTPGEMLELAAELIERARRAGAGSQVVDWSRFGGVLSGGPEPVEYQRRSREEWP